MKPFCAVLASALLVASATTGFARGTAPPPAPPPSPQSGAPARAPARPMTAPIAAPPVPSAIALADIPLEADRLTGVLRRLEARVAVHPAVAAIEAKPPGMARRITEEKIETTGQLESTSSITGLVSLADLWAGIRSELSGWAERVRARATDLGAALDELAVLNDTWPRTRDDALRAKAPPAVVKRTDEALAAIAATRALASAGHAALLNLQVKIGEQLAAVDEVSAQVAATTAADLSTLLDRDRTPVWRAWREAPPAADVWPRLRASAVPRLDVLAGFIADRSRAMAAHVVLLVLLVALTLTARRQIRGWNNFVSGILLLLERPIQVGDAI